MQVLDSLSRPLSLEGQIVSAHKNNTMILEGKEGKQLVDADFRPLSEYYPTMKYLKNGLILAKNKKEHTVMNSLGEVLYSGETPPEEILHCGKMVFTKGASFDLYDSDMQLLQSGCSNIKEAGSYTIAEKGGEYFLYNEQSLLLDGVEGVVLIDSISDHVIHWNKAKATIYQNGVKAGKIKLPKPAHFYNDMLFINGKDTCILIDVSGKHFMTIPEVEELVPMGEGRILIKTTKKINYFFDADWQQLLPEEKRFRQLESLSPTIFCYKNETGKTLFYNWSTHRTDTTTYQIGYGSFNSGERNAIPE